MWCLYCTPTYAGDELLHTNVSPKAETGWDSAAPSLVVDNALKGLRHGRQDGEVPDVFALVSGHQNPGLLGRAGRHEVGGVDPHLQSTDPHRLVHEFSGTRRQHEVRGPEGPGLSSTPGGGETPSDDEPEGSGGDRQGDRLRRVPGEEREDARHDGRGRGGGRHDEARDLDPVLLQPVRRQRLHRPPASVQRGHPVLLILLAVSMFSAGLAVAGLVSKRR